MLLGCYRKGEANDPETYTAAIAAVLSDYDPETIHYVTDPRTGVASKSTWMPNPGEVKKACEDYERPMRRAVERKEQELRQLQERETLQAITDGRPKKTYEQIVEECRAVGLNIGPKLPKKHEVDINAFLNEHGVSREAFDAIPDAHDYRWK